MTLTLHNKSLIHTRCVYVGEWVGEKKDCLRRTDEYMCNDLIFASFAPHGKPMWSKIHSAWASNLPTHSAGQKIEGKVQNSLFIRLVVSQHSSVEYVLLSADYQLLIIFRLMRAILSIHQFLTATVKYTKNFWDLTHRHFIRHLYSPYRSIL